MAILDLISRNRKRPGRTSLHTTPKPDKSDGKGNNKSNGLKADVKLIPGNPENATVYFKSREFKESVKTASVFFYGKVWFYNTVLETVLGIAWQKSREIKIIHSAKEMAKPASQAHKPLVILPSVHDQASLNVLVSKALETSMPVWFIGYPSTLAKHLLASFQSFILCDASSHEIEILSDVAELSPVDIDFLKEKQKRAVFISKGSAQSIHLEF